MYKILLVVRFPQTFSTTYFSTILTIKLWNIWRSFFTLNWDSIYLWVHHLACCCVVVALRSGKQTHSEGQCRWWSAVYYTGGPKEESSQRP